MSFLFGKKKPGSREVGSANPPANALREKEKPPVGGPQTTPGSSVNNSFNSLSGNSLSGTSPEHGRPRLDQDNQVSSTITLPVEVPIRKGDTS